MEGMRRGRRQIKGRARGREDEHRETGRRKEKSKGRDRAKKEGGREFSFFPSPLHPQPVFPCLLQA